MNVNILLRVCVAQEEQQEVHMVAVDGGHQSALTAHLLESAVRTLSPSALR